MLVTLPNPQELAALETALEAALCERSLSAFFKAAWPYFDSSPFKSGWHFEAICEHLEAVTSGEIRRLLVNVPPRHSKTSLIAITWPVWTWCLQSDPDNPLVGPGVRFLCSSYGSNKAEEDGVTARRLIGSDWVQRLWGHRLKIASDRDNQQRYDTQAGGSRINTGIPESLGKGGIIRIIDDPHKTKEVESDAVRQAVIRAYDEVWSTRSNDPQKGAEVVVMQRLAHNDLSGHLLETADDVVHLCLPAEYDASRHCVTVIGWEDPRRVDGEPLWPEMYPQRELAKKRRELGPFGWAGQYQQAPNPRGGGIVQREWWQAWPPIGEESSWERAYTDDQGRARVRQIMPDPEYILVAADTAYTEKEENDWSACTVWSVFSHRSAPRVMLVEAWRDRLELRALCERLMDTCRRRQADMLVIENKASGPSVQQEIKRLMREGEFQLRLENIKGDKSSRLHSVVPLFSGSVVYAPERKWADMVIDEVAAVPKGAHDDLADTVSLALNYLRRTGMARLTTEFERDVIDMQTFRGRPGNETVRRYGV